ncbi:MAG: PQQ-binding-like beta-propeller repeat protein, partial [Planctomycetota bacterium]
MKSRFRRCRYRILLAWVAFLFPQTILNADWPEHRGNRQRTGYVSQTIQSKNWMPVWRCDFLSPPEPAWPEPARGSLWQELDHIEGRVTDDRADVPLIVTDRFGSTHILVASSANDCLVSLDPATAQVRWRYVTRAPIRYAPSVAGGVACFGSDDGVIRALDISDGRELWHVHPGPDMPCVIGNGRIISSHPVRTSVVIDAGRVFAAVGLFPSQGVYLVALEVDDGDLIWRRKLYQSPQGYLLNDNENLFVPTGRAQPFAVRKSDGEFLYDLPSPGGSFCMLTPEAFFTGPGNDSSIQIKPPEGDAKMLSFKGKQVVAGNGMIWTANGAKLACHDMTSIAGGDDGCVWQTDSALDTFLLVTGN